MEPALASAALNPLSKTEEGAWKEWERISFSHWNPQLNLGSLHIGICDCLLVSQLEHQESVFPDLSTIVCDKANDLMLSAFIEEVNILTDRKMGHWEKQLSTAGLLPTPPAAFGPVSFSLNVPRLSCSGLLFLMCLLCQKFFCYLCHPARLGAFSGIWWALERYQQMFPSPWRHWYTKAEQLLHPSEHLWASCGPSVSGRYSSLCSCIAPPQSLPEQVMTHRRSRGAMALWGASEDGHTSWHAWRKGSSTLLLGSPGKLASEGFLFLGCYLFSDVMSPQLL